MTTLSAGLPAPAGFPELPGGKFRVLTLPTSCAGSGQELVVAWADRAFLERCFTTPHTNKVSWEVWLSRTRAVGPERNVVSTDLGQPDNPAPEDGLALAADRLLAGGFSEEEVLTMTLKNTRSLAGLAPMHAEVRP